MPIYAYRCDSCGHAKDVLQKISDDPLTVCPACGAATFRKQVTAAGFQLKGSGWYVTDFRNNGSGKAAPAAKEGEGGSDAKPDGDKTAADKPAEKAAEKPAEKASDTASKTAASAPAAAPSPPSAAAAPPAGGSSAS